MWGAEAAIHCSVGDVDGEARWDFWHPVPLLILLATISTVHQRERIMFLLTALGLPVTSWACALEKQASPLWRETLQHRLVWAPGGGIREPTLVRTPPRGPCLY